MHKGLGFRGAIGAQEVLNSICEKQSLLVSELVVS